MECATLEENLELTFIKQRDTIAQKLSRVRQMTDCRRNAIDLFKSAAHRNPRDIKVRCTFNVWFKSQSTFIRFEN